VNDIKELIGKVGSFEILTESTSISFDGTIIDNGKNIVVYGRIDVEKARSLDYWKKYRIIGDVNSVEITLIDASILCSQRIDDRLSATLKAEPPEIIIGRKIIDDGSIRIASMELPEITWFFSEPAFEEVIDFNKESPVLLKYCFPDDITVNDELGTLVISRCLKYSPMKAKVEYTSVPVLMYKFNEPVSINTARKQMAKARNLFLFFADGYLPLNDIDFEDEEETGENYSPFCRFKLIFNFAEECKVIDEPFFVTTSLVRADMQSIWDKWGELYSHRFISAIYYEVIRNRATWINMFLNFTQAIELFENTYRSDYLKKNKNGDPYFEECIRDALTQLNAELSLSYDQIKNVVTKIKNARHFFTHYSGRRTEPTYHEVFAMCRVLHLTFLGLIYKQLGIPDKAITEAKERRGYSVFDKDISIILRQPVDNVDYMAFF
jgi:hypothetical protein